LQAKSSEKEWKFHSRARNQQYGQASGYISVSGEKKYIDEEEEKSNCDVEVSTGSSDGVDDLVGFIHRLAGPD
jgi:hypothetical protein